MAKNMLPACKRPVPARGLSGMPRAFRHQLDKLAIAAVFLMAACSSNPDISTGGRGPSAGSTSVIRPLPGEPQRTWAKPGYDTVGLASWYGGRYHGRQTASGEIFDKNAPTAAHPTLPFGSRVHVTNLENGRSATVRINDRGPFVQQRIIDVSRRVAEMLGFVQQGITRVRVQLVQRGG